MSWIEYLLLFISVILGGGFAFKLSDKDGRLLKTILAFSGAYVLGIIVLHLLPSIFIDASPHIGAWILVGFFVQLLLEYLTQGVEHGHIHAHHHRSNNFALSVMIGLSIHAFLEGMPLENYMAMGHAHHTHNHYLYGIIMHKAPAAFALASLFLQSKISKTSVWIYLIVFAFMSPLGALTGKIILDAGLLSIFGLKALLGVVVGALLHISTTILFESDGSSNHSISWQKLISIIAGMGIAVLTS